jgi:hypothetical protein
MGERMNPSETTSRKRVFNVKYAPPEDEVPVALAPDIRWSGDGIALAVPSLLLYSTGFELLILVRSRDKEPRDFEQVDRIEERLRGLRINGRAVTLTGGEFLDHGSTWRAWVPASALVDGDQVVTLDWPGIEASERRIARETIVQALPNVTALW